MINYICIILLILQIVLIIIIFSLSIKVIKQDRIINNLLKERKTKYVLIKNN